tara:strand:- start:3966 stop:4889 length:924 start_codon:yes stop_codon:yes gene_type:complete
LLFTKLFLEYTCHAPQAKLKPANKNNLIRSAFGACLRKHDSEAYECFFQGLLAEKALNKKNSKLAFFSPECFESKKQFKNGDKFAFQMSIICPSLVWSECALALPFLFSEHGFGLSEVRAMYDLKLSAQPKEWPIIMNSLRQRSKDISGFDFNDLMQNYHNQKAIKELEIQLALPLRLKRGGKLVSSPNFIDILFACYRRLTHIYKILFLGQNELPQEIINLTKSSFSVFSQAEVKWQNWYRKPDSSRQNNATQLIPMGGIVGKLEISKNESPYLNAFLPLLKAGEFLHIGKNITAGNGLIKIFEKT